MNTINKVSVAAIALAAIGLAGCNAQQTALFTGVGAAIVQVYGGTQLPPALAAAGAKAMTVPCADARLLVGGSTATYTGANGEAAYSSNPFAPGSLEWNSLNGVLGVCAAGTATTVTGLYTDLVVLLPYLQKVDAHFTAEVAPTLNEVHKQVKIHPNFGSALFSITKD